MARYTGPKCKLCRREGVMLYLKGSRCFTGKCAIKRRETPPGMHGWRRTRRSEYGVRLREKQKVKRWYGVLDRQFQRYFEMAERQKGNTGENLLVILERRLDSVLYWTGFATSRPHARQMIRHGHVRVNGRKVDIPSMLVGAGDEIMPMERDSSRTLFKDGNELTKNRVIPSWLEITTEPAKARVVEIPKREDIPFDVNDLFVVEIQKR
jgi:small subunit ribosomal protein S4